MHWGELGETRGQRMPTRIICVKWEPKSTDKKRTDNERKKDRETIKTPTGRW